MRSGRILTGLLLIGGLIGLLVGGGEIYTRFLYLGVLLIGVSWLWTQFSLRGINVTRRARSLRASVGDVFEEHFELLGVRLPYLRLPVSPGRNMAVILAVAARNQLLKRQGFFTARELDRKLREKLSGRQGREKEGPRRGS